MCGSAVMASPLAGPHAGPVLAGFAVLLFGSAQLFAALRATGRVGFLSGAVSVVVGAILIRNPALASGVLALFFAGSLALDGLSQLFRALRVRDDGPKGDIPAGVLNLGLAVLIGLQQLPWHWAIGVGLGLRLLSQGRFLRGATPAKPDETKFELGGLALPANPELDRVCAELERSEDAHRGVDASWILALTAVLFAVHYGRMEPAPTLTGALGPLFATLGDLCTAWLLAFVLVIPTRLGWRAATRFHERAAWGRHLAGFEPDKTLRGFARIREVWLRGRLRFSLRMARARASVLEACRQGLRTGLPLTTIVVATAPMLGFSWFYNSEAWSAGVWDAWAATRADDWRIAMVAQVRSAHPDIAEAELFRVRPQGCDDGDFAFIVIGDTGEGDASQWCLKDRLLEVGRRVDTRFVVVASDVVYPSGEMKDYEFNFHLPFKGIDKPIYAVPGNHDWYDALDGFNATFLEPGAARAAMRGRRAADHGLTTTTEAGIEDLLARAEFLRSQYGIAAAKQRAPYFEMQTADFALIVADTGVVRRVDDDQLRWLEGALRRAAGKFKMVILGHPLYAAGRYQADADPDFAAIHRLLKEHSVSVVMAGDTPDFEYYREDLADDKAMHHFVNGGGGAYLSIGTSLDWPEPAARADTAVHPRRDAVVAKLDAQVPGLKRPLWYWVRRFGARPFTAEAMSAAFDFNTAPFFQSFVEVRVDRSRRQVRLLLHGDRGRLKWRDMDVRGRVMPAGATVDDEVEFAISMPAPR